MTKSIAVRIPVELYEYLTKRAENENRTLSNMIVSSLKKQEPADPKYIGEQNNLLSICVCGRCGEPLSGGRININFCAHCGQAVKWE